MKKERLYVIVGRVGTGKKYLLKKILEKIPEFKPVKFYTTNPVVKDHDRYEYITPEDALKITDKVVDKVTDGYESFTTPAQLEKGDVCIIDPAGLAEIGDCMPDMALVLLHVAAWNLEAQLHAMMGAGDVDQAAEAFRQRADAENAMYTEFEKTIDSSRGYDKLVNPMYRIQNDFIDNSFDTFVEELSSMDRKVKNVLAMIQTLKAADMLVIHDGKTFLFQEYVQGVPSGRYISDIQLAYEMIGNPDGLMPLLMDAYFALPDLDLNLAAATNTKVEYCYRDASNYKVRQSVVVEGTLSPGMAQEIMDCLDGREYFIPSQVGLPEKRFDDITEEDHCWFEGLTFESTKETPTVDMTCYELYKKFIAARGMWFDSI